MEHIIESIVLAGALEAFELRDQVQVMVSEHHYRVMPQVFDEAQDLQRLRSAIHEIADEPQPIRFCVLELRKKLLQLIKAALDIADRVNGHDSLKACVETAILYRLRAMLGRKPGFFCQ